MKVVCIPALNEEKTIARVVIQSQSFADAVIVCDDGSADMTALIAERLGAEVIRHGRNMGKGEALRSLFLAARKMRASVMVTIDGDGQHDPQEIPKLIAALEDSSADVVIGSRFSGQPNQVPEHRKFVNKVLNSLTVNGITDTQSGFRAYSKKAIESIIPGEMGMGADSEIIIDAARAGLKIVEVPVSVRYGIGKTSKLNPVYHTLDVVFSIIKLVSIRHPLLFYGIPGLIMVIGGLYFGFRTYQQFSQEQIITNLIMTYGLLGFALTLFGLLTFFTGIMLFTISTMIRKSEPGGLS